MSSYFQTGSGAYTCRICQKRTRETGFDESTVELCAGCYLECLVENAEADYGVDSPDYRRAKQDLDNYKGARHGDGQ